MAAAVVAAVAVQSTASLVVASATLVLPPVALASE
jgi:hypothetical protein